MDKIDQNAALLATGVAESRTFFLQLAGPWQRPLAVALGGWERCGREYRMERRRYPFTVLEVVTAGRGLAVVGGRTIKLGPGTCFSVGPRTACTISTQPGGTLEKYFLAMSGDRLRQMLRRAGLMEGADRQVVELGEIREMADLLIREGRGGGSNARSICAHLAAAIIEKIGEQPASGEDTPAVRARRNFERCRAMIDARATEWRGLGEIAAAAGIDSSSVCRLFRRFLGISPHQYLIQRRMAAAATWLIEPGASVQSVAARVGMDDAFHFSRQFRAVHGVPPSTLLRLSSARTNNGG